MIKRKKGNFPILLLLVLFFITACAEKERGCLDVRATNYQVDADEACSGCCTYPSLRMNFNHRTTVGDTLLNLSYDPTVYIDDNGNPFRFGDFTYYLSEIHLIREDGSRALLADEVELPIINSSGDSVDVVTVEDNFGLVNPENFSTLSFGTHQYDGQFTAVEITLGLNETANATAPQFISEEEHPLATEDMYLSADSGYVFNQITFFRDTIASDTIPEIVQLSGTAALRTLTFPVDFYLDEGFNVLITLDVDYRRWFNGVDVKTDAPEEIATKIVNNFTESITVSAIQSRVQ